MAGGHAVIRLDGLRVPESAVLGQAGAGFRYAQVRLAPARLTHCMRWLGAAQRAHDIALDYARRRTAFGKPLAQHPLHAATLAALETEWRAAFMLAFHVVELLGKQECKEASPEELARLRLLIPVAKLYTAKQAVAVASEALESFGGAGYIEDTGLPRLLRDAQVLPIWEGTTNVLGLDVLRALEKTTGLESMLEDARQRLSAVRSESLSVAAGRVREAFLRIESFAEQVLHEGRAFAEVHARAFAFGIARTMAGMLLLEHADWSIAAGENASVVTAATRWCARDLARLEIDEGPVPSPIFIA